MEKAGKSSTEGALGWGSPLQFSSCAPGIFTGIYLQVVLFVFLDLTYEEPRLTAWYGELPYAYSRLTLQPNPNVCMYL